MDPIQAFRLQQIRHGGTDTSLVALRESSPSWGVAFDMFDKDGDGSLSYEESVQAFQHILGGKLAQLPSHKLREAFDQYRQLGYSGIDFKAFHQIVKDVSRYMADTPMWQKLEGEAEEEQQRQQKLDALEQRRPQEPDVYQICGIKKTQELKDLELKKEQALERARAAAKWRAAGQAVIESQKVVRRLGAARLASSVQRSTIQDAGSSGSRKLERAASPSQRVDKLGLERGASIDLPTDIPELKFRGYGSACFALSFSPDGSRLAGGYFDGCLRIFDVDTKSQIHTLSLEHPHEVGVRQYDNDEVEIANQRGRNTLAESDVAITNVCWVPNSRPSILASVDTAGTIGLWDLTKGRAPHVLSKVPGNAELNALAFSQGGGRMLVGGQECFLKLYDLGAAGSLRQVQTLGQWSGLGRIAGHTLKVLSLRIDPVCPDVFVSGGLDKQALLWDLRVGGNPAAVLQGTEISGDALDISRDGTTLLVGSHRKDNPLQLFDLRMLSPRLGEVTACCSYQWSGEVSESERQVQGPSCLLFAAAWDAFANTLIAAAGEKEGMGQIFRRPPPGSKQALKVVARVHGNGGAVYSAAVSEDARVAAFGGADGSLRLCDLRDA
mmetsp:Transcript_6744/g.18455  ORF Transcript_6744/g.18455 Transcript_6744/m.18455 type:complete len:610 (-) Transcript_6744:280-2109(-)